LKILPFKGLKTGVLAILVILIVSAMLLVDIVMIKIAEADLLSAKVREGFLLLSLISGSIKGNAYERDSSKSMELIEKELHSSGFTTVLLRASDTDDEKIIGKWGSALQEARHDGLKAVSTKSVAQRFYGTRWGVVWFSPERLIMSSPISSPALKWGSVTIGCDLGETYEALRARQITFLLFLTLYAAFLVLAGMYLFSRVVVAPVRKLLSMASGIEDLRTQDPKGGAPANEIDRLFAAVSGILSRLEENKARLRGHIASLERANKEIERARDEMVRSEKLASAGRLAAGFAHEIGNPLGIVAGYFELLKTGNLTESERLDLLDRAGAEIGRMGRVIRQMLNIARPSPPTREVIKAHEIINETIEFLAGQPWLSGIEIKTSLEARTDNVLGDPGQLREVLLNIIMNAADAMERKGTLNVRTWQEESNLNIEISDTGPGIPEAILSEVFEPFFTTKDPGKGTGLGLWVCYRIITSMGGSIAATASPEGGASIKIRLVLMPGQGATKDENDARNSRIGPESRHKRYRPEPV